MNDLSEELSPRMRRVVSVLLRLQTIYVCFGCLVMAFTFLFVVIFRYGFNADLFAYEEWLLVICFWLYFIASGIGTWENQHVNADLLNFVLHDSRKRKFRALLVTGLELAITLAMLYWSVLMMIEELGDYPNFQSTIALSIPFLVPRAAIFVGFGLMAFYSGLRFYVLLNMSSGRFAPEPDDLPDAEAQS